MSEGSVYSRQGFGRTVPLEPPFGLLIVDFVNGFADPDQFGGGNIAEAITTTTELLAHARAAGWFCAFSRIVFADDGADAGPFTRKVPSLLTLTENAPESAIVDALAPIAGELIVRKTVPSAFFGTTLAASLASRGVRTLIVAGAVTSGCVRASVVDAMSAGFVPVVLSDCVGDRAIGPHDANLFDIAQKYGEVMPWADFLRLTKTSGEQVTTLAEGGA